MDFGLKGRRALVTGGTGAIGRSVVRALAREGAGVVVAYRSDGEPVRTLGGELAEAGVPHRLVRADLTEWEQVQALAEACRAELGGLDVLVNNAGVHGRAEFGALPEHEWHRVVDTDLTSQFMVLQACLPMLTDGASVINVGASAAFRGMPGGAHYTAAKAGVVGLTRSLAKEWGPRGIRVNTIAPGVIAAPGEDLPPPLRQRVERMTALGRLGTPDEVAGAVLFLAGELARYVSGTTLTVDGGI